MELFNKMKILVNQMIFYFRLYGVRMMLAVFAVLLESFLAIGDVTIFIAFPEFFVPALLISLLFILKVKLKPLAFKLIIHNRFALTVVLFSFSTILYLHFFEWIQPF